MDSANQTQDIQLLDNCLVISFCDTDVSEIVEKLHFCICDVMKLVVLDPRHLYQINDYNLDALIVSDRSRDSAFSREAYRILREISPDVILIAEGRSYVDQNITTNINSQFDAFIRFDAYAEDVQLAVKDAIQKREFRLNSVRQSSSGGSYAKVARERYRPFRSANTTPVWLETLFGLFWIVLLVGLASLIMDVN